jgi:hypothetical protein
MPRPFDPTATATASAAGADDDGRTSNRSTARVLAAALAALLVSFLVIDRSAAAFKATSENAGNTFTPGRVSLDDDDAGAPLFELPALVPGEVVENCITVTYEGSVYPAIVRLSGEGRGPLAPSLRMEVDAGSGGRFDDCSDFQPSTALYSGTLDGFLDGHPAEQGLEVFRPVDGGGARTFRFSFGLPEDFTDQGSESTASFRWEVTTG